MSPRIFLAKCPPLDAMPAEFRNEIRLAKVEALLVRLSAPELLESMADAVRRLRLGKMPSLPPLLEDVRSMFVQAGAQVTNTKA